MLTRILISALALAPLGALAQERAEGALEEIIVTAEYRPVSVQQLPASITVLDQQAIGRRGAEHLEQLLDRIPAGP